MEDVIFVSCDELRKMFNDGKYWQRATNGEFNVVTTDRLAPAARGLPAGTLSQKKVYFDKRTGEKIAEVHQYLLPDNSIGGSGMPDPKRLLHDGKVYGVPSGPEFIRPTGRKKR